MNLVNSVGNSMSRVQFDGVELGFSGDGSRGNGESSITISSIGESSITVSGSVKSSITVSGSGESSITVSGSGESSITVSGKGSNGSGNGSSCQNGCSYQDFGVSRSGSPFAFSGSSSDESKMFSLGSSDLRGVYDRLGCYAFVYGSNGESVFVDGSNGE